MTKIAIVQFKASTNKNQNLTKILTYIKTAAKKGADLCAFPEFMMFYTNSSQSAATLAKLAETINGEFVTSVASSAKENSIFVVGTFYEKSKKKNRVYDTAFLVGKSGKILSTYRKIHLYDALGFKESNKLTAGSKITRPAKTSLGKLGMMICYDLRFPEMSRILASSGSEILIAPSAWVKGKMKEEHWLTINKTRAIENGCYVVAPDQVGNIYCGRSIVVDPYGKILLDMKKRQGIGTVNISIDELKRTRKSLPLLQNRRTDLYNNFKI
ncbi:MAG TPA: carbon-nitrogen hydrolase family protein [Nitrosopumilaceae archaeon]|nr:carbon-nitrogen hydrolase family protein [Nitrosopumilaceae archaeon]